MSEATLHDLFELLDLFVIEQKHDGNYRLVGSVPDWFEHLFPGAAVSRKPLAPENLSPFLENFLIDAQALWKQNRNCRTSSGYWMQTDASGREFPLEAFAIRLGNKRFLTIDQPIAAYNEQRNILQKGREIVLNKEFLEEEVRKRTEQIRNREEEVAVRLVAAAEFRDDETGAHIRRIGLYAEVLARQLGCPAEYVDNIRIAATMHDIGKIGIPDSILLKPAVLTDKEFEIIKQHSEIGAKMLENSRAPMINMAHDIALYHHEKWDGSGYPTGLFQEDIPLSARIVAIADVYDALVHKRVYKPPIAELAAIDIIKQSGGKHFDPAIIAAFLDLHDDFKKIAAYDDSSMFPEAAEDC